MGARGALPIVLPMVLHRADVALLFGWLTGRSPEAVAHALRAVVPWIAAAWTAALVVTVFRVTTDGLGAYRERATRSAAAVAKRIAPTATAPRRTRHDDGAAGAARAPSAEP